MCMSQQDEYDEGLADASDESCEPAPDLVDLSSSEDESSDSSSDFTTDEEAEEQSDHEDDELRWKPPKNWAKTSAGDKLLQACGAAV